MIDFCSIAIISIYFGSADVFMNVSCNLVRFIKYIKNRFTSNLPWSCRRLQNNILFFECSLSINVIHGKTVKLKYSQISGKLYFKINFLVYNLNLLYFLKRSSHNILSKLWQQNSILFYKVSTLISTAAVARLRKKTFLRKCLVFLKAHKVVHQQK